MTSIWQQIKALILIVQEAPAQFMQRCVAKLTCCHSWLILNSFFLAIDKSKDYKR
jgi:hypothetical protein